jgi:organic hydroperoxide reductase OsmC/OhrA
MGEHRIRLNWSGGGAPFTYETYSRNHEIAFKQSEKLIVSGAAVYRGDDSKADPEDLLVAALSSCHMLSFLAICAKKRLLVESYQDEASGWLENTPSENGPGKLWITRVVLKPHVVFAPGTRPTSAEIEHIHHRAHDECFIASSVKTDVRVEPR